MKTTIKHAAPHVWAWEVRAADGRGFAGVTTTRANVRALVRSSKRALAALVDTRSTTWFFPGTVGGDQ